MPAVCVLTGSAGVSGTVTFATEGDATKVTGTITGLAPGEHGFHIHQVTPNAPILVSLPAVPPCRSS